ncbi:MAG: CRISPR-associated protein Cas5 [Verrucomicrobia bacterium]|nr:CRISPR-associated protein Cas5 [Verrucomicrobiota bacterium]
MIKKEYKIEFEIAGCAAMFTRPDTGSSPVSYPAPTKSALKSIFESVTFSKEAYFEPKRVEICSPIVFHKYTTNYHGPLKKDRTVNFQMFATILENVCYKVYGIIESFQLPKTKYNPQHQLQEIFQRRLAQGYFHTTPFLGWKEFVPFYFGKLRNSTHPDSSINLIIPSMLENMYDKVIEGKVSPTFKQNVKIEKGVLNYVK